MRQFLLVSGVAVMAAGCNGDSGERSTSATEPATTTGGVVTTESGATTATEATTEPAVHYCHGFQASAEMPFLSLYVLGGEMLADGVHWPIECGRQGLWMFGLYPAMGGWDPMHEGLTLTVEVDVEGHNGDPAGHFFSGELDYHIGCGQTPGGLLGVAPVLPPEDLADLATLDGLPATVRVTVLAGEQALTVSAAVTLSAPPDLLLQGCGAGGQG